jgi:thiol-disulfide isomerase/thioredoxin
MRHLRINHGTGKSQSSQKFRQLYNSKDNYTMILYHAKWCGHCVGMKDEWKAFVKKALLRHSNLAIVEVEDTEIKTLGLDKEVELGFPTIRIYKGGKKVSEYDGARVSSELLTFADKYCTKKGGGRRSMRKRRMRNKRSQRRRKGGGRRR